MLQATRGADRLRRIGTSPAGVGGSGPLAGAIPRMMPLIAWPRVRHGTGDTPADALMGRAPPALSRDRERRTLGRTDPGVPALRRLLTLLVLLAAPLPALAQGQPRQDPFCTALRQLVTAAASGFDYVPRGQRLIPGSVDERRGVTRTGDGPPRGVIYAVMLRDQSRQRPNPVVARFTALQGQITRCLPEAEAGPVVQGQGGLTTSWRTPQAIIGLRRDDGEGFASTAEVELSVAARW